MAIPVAVILPLGILFLLSGLIVNFIQALLFVFVRPFSKNLCRNINKKVTELLWLEDVWLFDWWANIKVELYIDPEMWELMGKEHALFISNHRTDIDWLIGWVLAERFGCLGSSLALIKKSAVYLPVLGWSMWFSDYIFLERNWTKDENTLKYGFQTLCDYPQPFWLALFVEGTRFTEAKLLAAQEYAASRGLHIPKNVLIPRTKGFVTAVNELRSSVSAIYNVTVAIPKAEPRPTLLRIFRGQRSVVHVHIERHLMAELPSTASDIAQWCNDIFVAKDALLEQHLLRDTFNSKQCHDIGRPIRSLLVTISWSCFLIFSGVKFFEWCSFSWAKIAFCAIFLAIVAVLMQILIVFSQTKHSTKPNLLQQKLLQ